MSAYKLLLPEDYVRDLIKHIKHAKHRINMVALVILEDDVTREIFDALEEAAERGVEVSIGTDIYFTYRELGYSLSRWQNLRRKSRNMQATRKRLVRAGAKVHWLSQFGIMFFSRRTHTKWSIVDDTVFSFGGVNLYDAGIDGNDFMFRVTDRTLADNLSREHKRLIETDKAGRPYPDHVFGNQDHLVLIDGGKIGSSIIYHHAKLYAREAESIIYVSQYCPTGSLSTILKQKKAAIYFNPWQNADNPSDRFLIRFSSIAHSIKSKYRSKRYLHAKFMIFTMPGGQHVAITGSHNFVAGGGTLGTREVALETRDPAIINQLLKFVDTHIKSPKR